MDQHRLFDTAMRGEFTRKIQWLEALATVQKSDLATAAALIKELHHEVGLEQLTRTSAQRGLVPYVRSLEELHRRLPAYPALPTVADVCQRLGADLQELGLWNVKLGYDPDKDLALSVLSPKRFEHAL